jgi:transcriptional regulator GlxA family with amidase domain
MIPAMNTIASSCSPVRAVRVRPRVRGLRLDRSDDGIPTFDFRIVAPDPGVVPSNIGFSINVARSRLRDEADLVVITPIPRSAWAHVDERVCEVVRRGRARRLGADGAAARSSSRRGVLAGRRATTHWRYADTMAAMYPDIDVDPNVLYVQDGRIITSAGTAAGLDACLHLLRIELGAEMTNTIARRMVVPPQRDGGQAQFIATPLPASTSLSLSPITDWCSRTSASTSPSTSSPLARTCRRARSPAASRPTTVRRPPRGSLGSGSSTRSACSNRRTWA